MGVAIATLMAAPAASTAVNAAPVIGRALSPSPLPAQRAVTSVPPHGPPPCSWRVAAAQPHALPTIAAIGPSRSFPFLERLERYCAGKNR